MTRGSGSLELILDLSVFFCAAIGFGYGVIRTLVKKKALYAQMITGAVGCMMLGRLAQVDRALAGMESKYSFQLDLLGYVGVFLFLFCANAGVMDRIADDGTEKYLRYRWLALLAPLLVLGVYGLVALSDLAAYAKIIYGVVSLFVAGASYYHFKHAIFPDVEYGVIRCIRSYNWAALGYAFLHMGEMVSQVYGLRLLEIVVEILLCVDSLILLPLLLRGMEKWKT